MNSQSSVHGRVRRLSETAAELAQLLARSIIHTAPRYPVSEIRCEKILVPMRDGTLLATDIYLPPTVPAPAIAVRTPYGRGADAFVGAFLAFARRGYVVLSQDCRGTGDSEPDSWDYYMYEPEDGYDFVDWVCRQRWFNGFLGACGSSYVGQTQWHMAMHPKMSTIVPEVSGLGLVVNPARLHMFANAHARSVGKGEKRVSVPYFELERLMLDETLSSGYFNEPLYSSLPGPTLERFPHLRDMSAKDARQWLWNNYCDLSCAKRAEFVREAMGTAGVSLVEVERLSSVFGFKISSDAHTLPYARPEEMFRSFNVPVLLITGWYDWAVNDTLATWELLRRAAPPSVRSRCKLLITPSAHNVMGCHEGIAEHPELHHAHRTTTSVELLLRWYSAVRADALDAWPTVIFYLMGANEWYCADDWPIAGAKSVVLYLGADGRLNHDAPKGDSAPDRYIYDPERPTPTVGGSIVSYVYPPGSVDVSDVQMRPDVLVYTTAPIDHDVDVVGQLRLVLFASSSAVDTDFVARLSDVFPDGRAIQLQNGLLRARYRNLEGEPELLEPGKVYRFEIDMWSTANRFKAGHRIRIDISSADFPRFERHSNRAGESVQPICASQIIYHDKVRASHLILPVVSGGLVMSRS